MKNVIGKKVNYLSCSVIRGKVLGVNVYRGFAPLCDLARISKADIYDQHLNPLGTQRDLNPAHAKQAYHYVVNRDLTFWPEVFLCARDPNYIKYSPTKENTDIGELKINIKKIENQKDIAISRVDGNHRLHFTDGKQKGYPPITKTVSFCLAYDLSREQEITLFRDINDNQRRMNTSHLDNIQVRLTPEDILKRGDPHLYIAEKLGKDNKSPFFGKIYQGGKRIPDCFLPLRSLKTGVKNIFFESKKLGALGEIDAQYEVIRQYFLAVKKWQPEAWQNPRKYLLLRGAAFWAICLIGGTVIDRVLNEGNFSHTDMLNVLNSGKNWDWTNSGDFKGLGGQGGAKRIKDMVTGHITDSEGLSPTELAKKIMAS
jgi:DGQHR domain-containing protein